MDEGIALYIHIPFCVSKCSYCNFCSFVPHGDQVNRYIAALQKEIELVSKTVSKKIFSVYVGGGTPSILPSGSLLKIFNSLHDNFDFARDASVTIEANPNSFSIEKAKEFVVCGCNRVSFGLQSADSEVLKVLNRAHTYTDCVNAVNYANRCGITDINIDLMLGVPKQDKRVLLDTLQKVVSLPITHISAYGLIVEDGTLLSTQISQKKFVVDEDKTADMYDYTVDFLARNGFIRYEISNFAKPGFESVHNQNYWDCGEFLGLGLNAYSFLNGTHFRNTSDFELYCNNLESGIVEYVDKEYQTTSTKQEEMIMLALRTTKGLDIEKFNREFGEYFEKKYARQLKKLKDLDLITIENGFLKIKNLYVSNWIITEFFE